jgi:ribosomal-protein-alanine N-acetyltransferase
MRRAAGGAAPVPAGAAQAPALAALHAECFPPAEAWSAEAIAGLMAMPGVAALHCPGEGFLLFRVAAEEAEILTLAVRPEARRRGVGRALLSAAMAAASGAGARRMLLEVAATNRAARALYEGAGFVTAGVRRRYYADGTDALIFESPLPGKSL